MKTISFSGTVSARSELVLCSKRIGYPFRTRYLRATFGDGCNSLVTASFHICFGNEIPAAGQPLGINLLDEDGQVDYLTGDGETIETRHTTKYDEGSAYLKVYLNNTDYYDHLISAQITIDAL